MLFQRFAASSAIASMGIAVAGLVVSLLPSTISLRLSLLPLVWCFVPLVWGLWAMVAPGSWTPQRLPVWGAILGLMIGLFLAFVLNLPSRVRGEDVPVALRGVLVPFLVVVYYLLWMLVRMAHRVLARPEILSPGAPSTYWA